MRRTANLRRHVYSVEQERRFVMAERVKIPNPINCPQESRDNPQSKQSTLRMHFQVAGHLIGSPPQFRDDKCTSTQRGEPAASQPKGMSESEYGGRGMGEEGLIPRFSTINYSIVSKGLSAGLHVEAIGRLHHISPPPQLPQMCSNGHISPKILGYRLVSTPSRTLPGFCCVPFRSPIALHPRRYRANRGSAGHHTVCRCDRGTRR
jgi:hypothetical protein